MHGLSPETDLSFLIGKEVTQVAIGSHGFHLHFGSDIQIVVHCDITARWRDVNLETNADNPLQTKELVVFLERKVEGVDIGSDGKGTLTLKFSNGYTITIFDSNVGYESYVIWEKGDAIPV